MQHSENHPPAARKPYEKPMLESHRVFEVSLSCNKVSHSTVCNFNIHHTKS